MPISSHSFASILYSNCEWKGNEEEDKHTHTHIVASEGKKNNFSNCLFLSYLLAYIICYQFAHVYFIMFFCRGDFKEVDVRGGGKKRERKEIEGHLGIYLGHFYSSRLYLSFFSEWKEIG
jgi:hypothetical protein